MILGGDPDSWDIQCSQQDSVLPTRYIRTRFFVPSPLFYFAKFSTKHLGFSIRYLLCCLSNKNFVLSLLTRVADSNPGFFFINADPDTRII
jgi:hypothetical protein